MRKQAGGKHGAGALRVTPPSRVKICLPRLCPADVQSPRSGRALGRGDVPSTPRCLCILTCHVPRGVGGCSLVPSRGDFRKDNSPPANHSPAAGRCRRTCVQRAKTCSPPLRAGQQQSPRCPPRLKAHTRAETRKTGGRSPSWGTLGWALHTRGHGFPSSNAKEEAGLRRRQLLSPTSQRAPCGHRFCFRCEPRWVMLQLLLCCSHRETVCGDCTYQCWGAFTPRG